MPDPQNGPEPEEPYAEDAAPSGESAPHLARPAEIPLARPMLPHDPMLLRDISWWRALFHLGLIVGCAACYLLVVGVVAGIVGEERLLGIPMIDLTVTIIGGMLVIGVIALLLADQGVPVRPALGLASRVPGMDALLGILVLACSYGVFFLSAGLMWVFWPEGFGQLQSNPESIRAFIPRMNPLVLLVLMVVIGFYEEVLFRGILLTHVRRLTGSWIVAIVLVSAIFAALHTAQQRATAIPLFGVSVLWCSFTVWRRSLVPSMVGHVLFNYLQLLALSALE